MTSPFAFVTLLSSDSYLPGALAQVAALRDIHPSPPTPPEVDFTTVCIVTPESLDIATIKRLRKEYDLVVGVEILEQENQKGLDLLGPSLPYTHICASFTLQQADQISPLSLQSYTSFASPIFRKLSFLMRTSCPSDLSLIFSIFLMNSRLPQMSVGQIYSIRVSLSYLQATTSLMSFMNS
jgi:hypothetical protein